MLLWMLRGCFGLIIVGMATRALLDFQESSDWWGIAAFLGILAVGVVTVAVDMAIRDKQITTISAVYFGLLLGLVLGTLFSMALEPFFIDGTRGAKASGLFQLLRLLITLICCYVSVSTLLQTKDEFRFIIPYVEFSKEMKGGRPLVLDTSVIIDGRIADICDTRIIDTRLIVPRFVLQELQSVADSSDKLKRNRGRRGLDMLKRMQNNPKIELQVHEADLPELRGIHKVDERLVVLARALNARVVTNDYNLNKIAQLQGVEVINLNEVANALKSVALPGEILTVRLVKPGDQMGQGIGYLDDGTMVVVEQGRSYVGQVVNLTVTSVLQTPAGRMIFGRIDARSSATAAAEESPSTRPLSAEP
ncbi:MAG: PIN/TRAM domain-containing protein [Gemmataceae bacterium]